MSVMKSEAFTQIRNSLTSMSPDQLLTMEKTAHNLRSLTIKRDDTFEDWLYDALVENLRYRGLSDTVPPFKRVKASPQFVTFQENSQTIRELYANSLPRLSVMERNHLGMLIIQTLVHHLTYNWSFPGDTSFWGLLVNMKHAVVAMERAYPGYLRSGLMHLILLQTPAKELAND